MSSSPNGQRGDGQEARVLVVDDEEAIGDLVATTLRYEGFEVDVATSGRDGLARVKSFHPDALILDVMLGDIDGFEVLRRLRAEGERVPILFLTAADAPEDRVRGLTLGGDDYICKPFGLAELVARVRVVLRRTARPQAPERLNVADLEMNLDSLEVRRGGRHIELTPTEFKLLRYLMENARRVLSKDQIVDHVWNYDFDGDTNIVETYISYLRKKVDAEGPALVNTVRGFGYCLRPPRE
jgi:two-component system OmpR family response regulator